MFKKPSYEELEKKILVLEHQTQRTLKDSEEHLNALSDASFEALFLSDKGICLDQNQTAQRMFGYTRKEAVGQHGTKWIIPRDRELVKANMLRGYEEPYEVTALHKDGSTFPAEIQGRMIELNGRRVRVTALRDITWRKQTETLLKAERDLGLALNRAVFLNEALEHCLQTAMEVAGMDSGGIYLVNEDTGSLSLAVHKGLTQEFIIESMSYDATSEKVRLVMTGQSVYMESDEISMTFGPKWVNEGLLSVAIMPVDFRGCIIACLNVASHSNSRIAAFERIALGAIVARIGATIHQAVQEEALRESEAFFRRTFDESPMGAAVVSLDLTFQRVNAALCEITGYTPQELLKLRVADLVDPCDWDVTSKLLTQLTAADIDHFEREQRCLGKDGRPLWIFVSVRLVRDGHGNPQYLLPMFADITARKTAQMALKESEIRYRLLFDKAKDIIFLYPFNGDEADGSLLEVNQVAVEKLGFSREEFRTMTPMDLLGKKTLSSGSCKEAALLSKDKEILFEGRLYAKDGSSIPVEIHAHVFDYGESKAVLSIARDTSERKKNEQLLRTTAEIVDKIPSGLFVYDFHPPDKLYLVSGNPAAEKFTGIKVTDYIGKEYAEIWPLSVGLHQDLLNVVRTGDVFYSEALHYGEHRMQGSFKIAAFAMPNNRLGVAFENITEQKKLEEELRQAHKMEALGTLAGGIAHEFNNIISIILGSCELALADVSGRNPVNELLGNIRGACLRAKDIVKQLLSYSRKSDDTKKPLKLQPIIKETIKLLRASMPSNIAFRQSVDPHAVAVMADCTQINQVLINLCNNAFQSMEESGGTLEVTLENMTSPTHRTGKGAQSDAIQYVRLAVSDTGCGIKQRNLERIFDPFFSTKPVDKGTGMGLAVVHGIVKNHGGEIRAISKPDHGTTFEILFPAVAALSPVQAKAQCLTK